MNIPEWLQPTLAYYESRTEPFMEVQLGEAIGSARAQIGDLSDVDWKVCLAEHSAFMFMERLEEDSVWGTYFAPMMEGTRTDGTQVRMPDIELLDAGTIVHWQERAAATMNPLMRSRYADCVWDLGKVISGKNRLHEYARMAAEAYIDATEVGLYKSEINGVEWLARALSLAKTINDQPLVSRTVEAMLAFRDHTLNPAHIGVWIAPFDFLYGEKGLLTAAQETKIITDLETMLAIVSSPTSGGDFDPFGAQAAAERLSKHYKTKEERQRLVKTYGSAFEAIAKGAAPMLAMAWMQPVIERYEQVGLKGEAERLALFAAEKGSHIANDLKTYTVTAEVDNEKLDALVGEVLEGGDLELMLHRVAKIFLPDTRSAKDMLEKARATAPLQSLIEVVISRADGQPLARIGSIEDDQEGRLQKQISDNVMFLQPFLVHTLTQVVTKTTPTPDQFTDVLYGSPVFTDRRKSLIREGISAYLIGDYVKAIHVLVPQVEELLRNLLGMIGVPVYKTVKDQPGITDVKSLGEVLRDPRMQAVLSENRWRYLSVLYTDRRGVNLRNNVAHGLVSLEALNRPTADLVIHSLLSLCLLRKREIAAD